MALWSRNHFEGVVLPEVEGIRSGEAERSGGKAVSAGSEHCVGLIMSRLKPLRVPMRFEPAHEHFALSGRPVLTLDRVVQALMRTVVNAWGQLADRLDIAAQFVRDDHAGLAKVRDQPLQKTLCSPGISP